ncbi:protein peste-like isoform X1 [Coccinella septempunctata]|uniref:protein peste-like isoform X1 n=1 Tax=Coccinella septempunctata TaxID=41139 RepID=UPI001D0796CB|nr:protein peste-like isoform X1 [Coccinella septempunctata]
MVNETAVEKTNMFDDRCKTKKLRFIVCAFITPLVFISSGIILIILRTLIYNGLKSEVLSVTPGSKSYEIFKKTPFDIYLDIYFFNWTNPEEFSNPLVKPKFEEIGPFRFLEVMEKTNITFHDNSTVSYNRTRRWYFDKEFSPYDLHTPITSINPVAASGGYAMRHESIWTKKLFSIGIRSILGRMDMTQSVANVFFDGYEDPLINLGKSLPFVKQKVPPMDKFGWFYKRNGSNEWDGRYNMGTGSQTKFGQLYKYNNMEHSPFFKDRCGDIRGSAGEFFPAGLGKQPLELFNPEMCRTIVFDYVEEERKKMINGYKFTLGDHFFDNGTIYPENVCYCSGDCVPYGVMNISLCRYGSPGFVSLPHFYKADPYFINLVDGMKPSKKHDFYMIIEPTTGLPLEVSARLQINLLVKNVPGIGLLEDRNDVFFPIFWFEQVVEVPTKYSFGLLFLLWLKEICILTGLLMICSGIIIMSIAVYRICTTPLWTRPEEIYNKELVPLNQEKR